MLHTKSPGAIPGFFILIAAPFDSADTPYRHSGLRRNDEQGRVDCRQRERTQSTLK
jgi:hypothetical protein